MKPWLRVIALVTVLVGLAWALCCERHLVQVAAAGEARQVPGMALRQGVEGESPFWPASFTEGATTDAWILKDGVLLNANSLAAGQAGLKDCKT